GLSLDHEGRRNASNGSPRLTVARSQPALNPIALAARRIAAANTPPARQPPTRRSRAAEQCDELAPPHAGHRAPSQVPRPILPAKDAERRQFRRTLGLPLEGQPSSGRPELCCILWLQLAREQTDVRIGFINGNA